MNINRALQVTGGLLFVALAFVLADTLRDRLVNVGDKAPNFTVVTESGKTLSRDNFGGKLLVLNFWATWCPPCVQEMPSLNQFQEELKGAGVVVLAVSVDHNADAYKRFVQRFGLRFETARDEKADIPASYGTYKYPETYVINAKGEVLEKFIGEENWADPQLIQRIKRLL
jgi:cytochrome c biogenesis protein CcmG, thiol:disulfide interchange protein DsbE